MLPAEQRIQLLFDRYTTGTLTVTEEQEFYALINSHPDLVAGLGKELLPDGYPQQHSLNAADRALIMEAIMSVEPPTASPAVGSPYIAPVHRVPSLRKWSWIAASMLLLLGAGVYFWSTGRTNTSTEVVAKSAEIVPGKNGAILTLADGSQVVLDSLGNGVIATQQGAQVVLANGQLRYDPGQQTGNAAAYNTMTTPKGRQFRVILPDGTQVWLNAASSLRYPTAFTGSERKVTVTGEAYFEVAKNASMPFRVNVNSKEEIEVLGTHFNVNSYENESSLNTTLLEGSIKVNGRIIQPGQQAQLVGGALQVVSNANMEKAMAWKNGLFNFNGAGLQEVMRQLERWYEIEVVYEKGIPAIHFRGEISRDVSLSGLLVGLERSMVHFRVEGRKLIVLP